MSSINYNAAASSALRVLQSSNSALDATQSRISTGLKIGQAKDNAAYWSIATTMKSDNKALGTVKDALGLGAGTVDTAYQGLDAARAQLDDMKTKLTSALNPNVDREAVQKDIDAYLSSLKSIATSSVFSGENWLSVNSSVPGYSNTKQVVSSYSRDANGTVAIETIAIDTSKIALIDTNANGNGVLTSQSKLSAGGVDLAIGGNAATGPAPALAGLTGAATETKGTVDAAATTAKADLGFFNIAGLDKTDKLVFSLSVNGQAAKSVTVDLSTVTNASTFKGKVQDAIDAQFAPVSGVKQATVDIDTTTGKITLQTTQTGANAAVEVTGLVQQDGDGTKTALGGLTDANGIADGTSTAAKYLGAAAVDGAPGTLNNTISFDLEVGGVKKSFSFANNNGSGTKLTAAQLITKVHDLVTATDGTGFGSAVTVADDGSGKLLITTAAKGEAQRVIVTNRSAEFDAVKLNGAETRGTDTAATYVTDNFSATGLDVNDRISFDMTLNGTKKTIVAAVAAADGDFRASIQKSIDAAFGANVIKLATSGSMDFSTVAKGDSQHLTMSNLKAVDGNGTITSTLGLANGAAQGSDATSLAKASTLTGSAFTAPITFDAQDSQSFSITVNGGAKKTVTVNKASVEAALTGQTGYVAGSGTVSSASDYAKVLQAALGTAGVTGVNVTANTTAGLDFNKIKFEAATAGAGTISIDAASVTSTSGASTISVNEISITSDSFKALTKDQQTQVINAYINVVSDKLKAVTSAASMMGSVSARIESQKTFVSNLMDTIDKGVSGLVDADMNEESTKLQALQVKQQLGVQALSIANQSAQSVLRLFQ